MQEHHPDRAYFEQMNELTQPIADTNARLELVAELQDPEFEAIATTGLTQEQQIAFDALTEATDYAKYDSITEQM